MRAWSLSAPRAATGSTSTRYALRSTGRSSTATPTPSRERRRARRRRASLNRPIVDCDPREEAPADGGEERAWKEYPPEAAAYGEYLRRVMRRADALCAPGAEGREQCAARGDEQSAESKEQRAEGGEEAREELITNAVIDYEGDREGCPMHRGAGENGSEGGWWDPSYRHVGSCSRSVRESVELHDLPYSCSLHDRAFSMVTLDCPTYIPPDDEGSFYQQVVEPLVALPEEYDQLLVWLGVFFKFAAGKKVAYFARYTPSHWIFETAAKHNVQLIPLPLDAIPDEEREQHRHFRFLWVTRPEWEQLVAGLQGQGR